MNNKRQVIQLRRRKLAALIYDSRLAARRTLEECAEALVISPQEYQELESGTLSPTLPQLEILALYLDVPLDHFWGKESAQRPGVPEPIREQARTVALRNRLIGASIRLGRTNVGLAAQDLAAKTGLSEETLNKYELGEIPVPLPELEVIAAALDTPVERYFDQKGPIGHQRVQQELIQQFLTLPEELQEFITRPVNLPYLELAQRLSRLDVQKLRSIAEGLLEITF